MKPYAILNEKLCDNYINCPAMLNCAKGANAISLSGSEHTPNRKITIDKNRCKACMQCIDYCGLFRIAKNLVNEEGLRGEFAQNPLTNAHYQSSERFGCDVFDKAKYRLYTTEDIDAFIAASSHKQFDILEFVDDNNLLCPFQGISVTEIEAEFPEQLREYRKYVVMPNTADAIYTKYKMDDLPVIFLLHGGHVVREIYGRYRVNSFNDLAEKQAKFIELKKKFSDALIELIKKLIDALKNGR